MESRGVLKRCLSIGTAVLTACMVLLSGCAVPASKQKTEDTNVSDSKNVNYEYQNYEYKTEELYANRDGNQIYGVIYIPKNAGKQMPAIIFSHGFGGNYQVGTQYARGLAARGYVVYCFDFCGGSPESRSDGSVLDMSIFTEQKDLEAVISMIQKLDYVDADNLFLMGTSQGGAVSAITAAVHKDEIRGAVLLYPAFCLVDMTKERFSSVEEIPDTYFSLWMTVGRAYAENLLDYDIYEAISAYKKDVLILHGDADSIVPLSYSQKALEVYSSARLEVFPGAGHGFHGEDAEHAIELMLEYLGSNIRKTTEQTSYESVEGRQIMLTAGDVEVVVTLNNSKAAEKLADASGSVTLELKN